jgi:hypothetical protein
MLFRLPRNVYPGYRPQYYSGNDRYDDYGLRDYFGPYYGDGSRGYRYGDWGYGY